MTASNLNKVVSDLATIATSALTAVPGATVISVALSDAQAIKDLVEQLLLLMPPIDAPALDPSDRAAADAAAAAAEAAKFPKS
jgi:hypothetical protein